MEQLQWADARQQLPDADSTVLLWIGASRDCPAGWEAGWWDGEAWRLAESGGLVDGEVTHWAAPQGPAC